MSVCHNIFRKTNLVWIIGIPLVTVIFFFPYWYFLCPIIWNSLELEINDPLITPWFFSYWIMSFGIWIIVWIIAFLCKKYREQKSHKSVAASKEFLLGWNPFFSKSSDSVIPLTSSVENIQPYNTGANTQRIEPLSSDSTLLCSQVQPPKKCLPPSRPSENELCWENDIPWLQHQKMATFHPKRKTHQTSSSDVKELDGEERNDHINGEDEIPSDTENADVLGIGDPVLDFETMEMAKNDDELNPVVEKLADVEEEEEDVLKDAPSELNLEEFTNYCHLVDVEVPPTPTTANEIMWPVSHTTDVKSPKNALVFDMESILKDIEELAKFDQQLNAEKS